MCALMLISDSKIQDASQKYDRKSHMYKIQVSLLKHKNCQFMKVEINYEREKLSNIFGFHPLNLN